MTPTNRPSHREAVRDEMAEEYYLSLPVGGLGLAKVSFIAGFDASTKYHKEKYQELLVDARKLVDALIDGQNHEHVADEFIAKYGGKGE